MAKLVINADITDTETKVWYNWDGLEAITSDDVVNFINNLADGEKIDMRLHCNGGSVTEGMRIYDALRTSGKEITATVEGMCASMATVILLAAPKEKRFAYKNASLCIHNPEVCRLGLGCPDRLTADEVEALSEKLRIQAESLREVQNKIVNIYVERTGSKAEDLQELMDKDIIVDMNKAKELGFISSFIEENTASISNHKQHITMKKETTEVNTSLFNRILSKLGFKSIEDVKFDDMVLTATDGTEITIEKESGTPAVGDHASPDGEKTLMDGTKIVITDGVITAVTEPAKAFLNPKTKEPLDASEVQSMLDSLNDGMTELSTNLGEMTASRDALQTQVDSLQARISELEPQAITEEQRSILSLVDELGGIDAIQALRDAHSAGAPRIDGSLHNHGETEAKLGQSFLASIKNQRFIK